jgi:transposase
MDQKCVRGIRYLITDKLDELEQYIEVFRKGFAIVSKHVFDKYPNLPSYNFKYKLDGCDKDLKQTILEEVRPQLHSIGLISYDRCVVLAVLSNYQSFRKRNRNNKKKHNGFPSRPIMLKDGKAIRFDDQCIKDKNGKLSFPGLNGKRIEVKYTHPGTISHHKKWVDTSKAFGGTLACSKGQWRFTAGYNKPIIYQYEPTDWWGFDANATDHKFVVGSDGIEFGRTQECVDIENELTRVNTILRDPKTTGSKRRYHNNLREKLHKQHNKLILPIVNNILDYVKSGQLGISIDQVTGTGTSSGSWGQDKLLPELLKRCQNEGVPYYLSNPKNTSRKCSLCGYTDKKNRLTTAEFKCQQCGYEICAHLNGAINTANAAIEAESNVQWCIVD